MDKNATLNPLLDSYLKGLRLPGFLQHYRALAQDALRTSQPYDRFLLALVEQEIAIRSERRENRTIKAARFPVLKELSSFDFSCVPSLPKLRILDLARGAYIRQAEPIILIGNPGVGKTHIAIGLALAACRQGYKIRFYNAAGLVNELAQAQDQHLLPRFLKNNLKQHVVVIDELGFIPFSPSGAQLLFQFCSSLYERAAIIITSNLAFGEWTQVFGEERLTAALLDRLTHRAHIIEFIGDSYRFRQRMQQETHLKTESVP